MTSDIDYLIERFPPSVRKMLKQQLSKKILKEKFEELSPEEKKEVERIKKI